MQPGVIVGAAGAVRVGRAARARRLPRRDADGQVDAPHPRDDVLHGGQIKLGARRVVVEVDLGGVLRVRRPQPNPPLVVHRGPLHHAHAVRLRRVRRELGRLVVGPEAAEEKTARIGCPLVSLVLCPVLHTPG